MKYMVFILLTVSAFSYAEEKWKEFGKDKIKVSKIFTHKGVIWGFDFLNSNEILFSKRDGELYHYDIAKEKFSKQSAPKVQVGGQGGLLDVFLIKEGSLPQVYLIYSKPHKEHAVTALAKGVWQDGKLQKLADIFVSNAYSKEAQHFGSRLALRKDELFMTVGERGIRDEAQNIKTHHGTILRLTLDGKPYPNNPFVKNGLPEIYSYGHRNPQGIALGIDGKNLFDCEFGPRGGDEINLIEAGKNYGWPVITYGFEYHGPKIGKEKAEGMQQPLVYYTPAISPSGMAIYSGERNQKFRGNFFLAALGNRYVHRLVFDGKYNVIQQQKWLEDLGERIRQIKEGPDGNIYFSTDSGKFYRIDMDNIKVD